jgi:hypothetical protein
MREDVSVLDDQVRETVSRVLDSLRGRLESELGACQDDLMRAAQEATRIAAEAADGAKTEVLQEAAARDAEELRARLIGEIEDLQRRLDETREDSQRQIEEIQRRVEESQLQIAAAGQDADTSRQQAEAAQERANATQGEAEAARAQAEAASRDLESVRQELEATRENVEATLEDIERARRDSDAARAELRQLNDTVHRTAERAAQAARLPDAIRALDQAVTFGEVLERLAQSAGREAGRAVVFLVKGERLRDWRTVGFHLASDQLRLDIALSESGPMAEAIQTGEGVRQGSDEPLLDFAHSDEARNVAAWPVSVGGSCVAVLYADGPVADKPDEPYWPAFLDVLARHAGRVLEGITVRQAAGLMTGPGRSRSASMSHQSSGSIQ